MFGSKKVRAVGLAMALVALTAGCDVEDWAVGGVERPYFCDPTDVALNDGHGAGHVGGHHFPYTVEKGPLSTLHCLALDIQLDIAAEFASQFPTAGVAEANGWHHLAPYIPGQGTHHVNVAQGVSSTFNALRPTMLMYDSNSNNAQLTGMVWVVQSGHAPPAGFNGDNDHWHAHESLCYRNTNGPFIIGDSITDAECASRGGTNVDSSDTWLLHVWLPEYDGWQATDIFNKTHPTV